MKVLAYTSPARGHLYPLVPILDELDRRGHSIAVCTLASQVSLVRERGFAARPISRAIEELQHDDYRARTPLGKMKRGMAKFGLRAEHEVADMRAAIDEERPDAILVDAMSWGATAVAEAWGGPWSQWFPYPMPLSSRDAPPFGPGLKPPAGPLDRLRDRALRPMLTRSVQRACFPSLNAVRASVGVRPFSTIDEMYTVPPLILYMTAEPFEYPRSDWPTSVRMVGPCCWEPPAEAPEWLDGLERPLVLVSTSSEFQDDGRLVTTTLESLAEEPVQVIATVPSVEMPRGQLPANALIEPFLPHTPILARAACAITHGGAGATQKALAAGVPVCVVPFGRDQLEVARRVEMADAGTRLPASRLTAERLRDKVREAMTKTPGARRVADGFAQAGGPVAAAQAFESLAGAAERASAVASRT